MSVSVSDPIERFSEVLLPFLQRELLYSTIVCVVVWLILLAFKKSSPRWQLGLWLLVLIRLVLPPNFSHSLSGRYLLGELPWIEHAYHRVVSWIFASEFPTNTSLRDSNSLFDEALTEKSNGAPIPSKSASDNSISVKHVLVVGWLAGVVFFLGLYGIRRCLYFRVVRKATVVVRPQVLEMVFKWRKHLKISRLVRIVSSEKALSPFTIGIFQPMIFLPHTVMQQNDLTLLESIIAHELAHIKRLDDLWLKLQNVLQILYFFHPAVWIANRKICLARECICDSLVLAQDKISPPTYGQSILTILKLNLFGSAGMGLLPGFGSQHAAFRYRIQQLKGGHSMQKLNLVGLYMVLFAVGLFILPMASQSVLQSTEKAESTISVAAAKSVLTANESVQKMVNIDLELPVRTGKLSAKFGKLLDPFTKTVRHHRGVDIAAPIGTNVYAVAAGKVISADSNYEKNKGYGKNIILQHNAALKTRYGKLDTIFIQSGESVSKGQIIGAVGNTGRSTGPHLHFELIYREEFLDPMKHIDFSELKPVKE